MNTKKEIYRLFGKLSADERKAMIGELEEMIKADEIRARLSSHKTRKRTHLEKAWDDIQENLSALEDYRYVSDQALEISNIWDICEDLAEYQGMRNESWDLRKMIIEDLLINDLYADEKVDDPFGDLVAVLCVSNEEKLACADMIEQYYVDRAKSYAAKIYRDYGDQQKYYDYLEEQLKNKWLSGIERAHHYQELINYYSDKDPAQAEEFATAALKKCHEDQTPFMFYLMKRAKETGDLKKYQRLDRSAKRRIDVDYQKLAQAFNNSHEL